MNATNYKSPEDINEEYINLLDRLLAFNQSYLAQPDTGKGDPSYVEEISRWD